MQHKKTTKIYTNYIEEAQRMSKQKMIMICLTKRNAETLFFRAQEINTKYVTQDPCQLQKG